MFKKQQWLKAIVYRFYSVLITFLVSYLFTGEVQNRWKDHVDSSIHEKLAELLKNK